MSNAHLLIGDVFARLAEIPDGSIDLVTTSPPFLALRSYLPDDHPDKHLEIGSEPDPASFIDTQLRLTGEYRRVLAPHGSIAVEFGDTYAGSGGTGGDYSDGGLRDGQPGMDGAALRKRQADVDGSARRGDGRAGGEDGQATIPGRKHYTVEKTGDEWPMDKSLCGIPHLYHLSLAYGRNLLTGEPSPAGRWMVRNVVAWCRPNPPVGELFDKFRPATSYMTVATLSRQRYFDLDAVRRRNPLTDYENPDESLMGRVDKREAARAMVGLSSGNGFTGINPNGTPPLDWWDLDDEDVFEPDAWVISGEPYAGSHYATWPKRLCKRPIEAMVPHRVCTTCGEPSRRIVDVEKVGETRKGAAMASSSRGSGGDRSGGPDAMRHQSTATTTVGWTDCGHGTWRRGIVLDPFAGSGTTLAVATGMGRDAVGIDLDERNADLCRQRIGMFLMDGPPEWGTPNATAPERVSTPV